MTRVRVGRLARRAALVAGTAFFSTCAPASISEPPPMRPVPEGPALAGQRIGMLDLSHVTSAKLAAVTGDGFGRATIAATEL